jgi:uncharacterized OsmC-like protein
MTVKVSAEADNENLRYSKMTVTVASSLSNKILENLIEQAKKYCYVTNTILQCCPIEYGIG